MTIVYYIKLESTKEVEESIKSAELLKPLLIMTEIILNLEVIIYNLCNLPLIELII